MFNLGNGQMRLGNHVIRDTHVYGSLSLRDVVAKSSNVGAIKLALQVPDEYLYDVFSRFGFGHGDLLQVCQFSFGTAEPITHAATQLAGTVTNMVCRQAQQFFSICNALIQVLCKFFFAELDRFAHV